MEEFYFCGEEKIPLKKSKSVSAVEIENPDDDMAKDLNFKIPGKDGKHLMKKKFDKKTFIFEKISDDDLQKPDIAGKEDKEVDGKELNVYKCSSDERMVLTDEFFLRFKIKKTDNDLDNFIRKNNLTMLRKFSYDPNLYLFKLRDSVDALNKINNFHGDPDIDFSNPNFLRILKKQFAPGDNKFGLQTVFRDGFPFNINVQKAWDLTKGKNSITISIMDDGVDYNHRDLKVNGKLVKGFDFVFPDAEDPSPVGNDSHGTSCAGIASAANNDIGIVGVAPGCKLMGLRVAEGSSWETDMLIPNAIDAFEFAVQNNVDVVSCSWGLQSVSPELRNVINWAKRFGRGGIRQSIERMTQEGKGLIICFAAGNFKLDDIRDLQTGEGDFEVLGTAKLNSVISVGAYGDDGNNKLILPENIRFDFEKWGSRYIGRVDVLAPGTEIYSLDISGVNGQVRGDYFSKFNGTSAATPFVSGAAALMLSVNENLTADQIKEILVETSNANQGRLNVFEAVNRAKNI